MSYYYDDLSVGGDDHDDNASLSSNDDDDSSADVDDHEWLLAAGNPTKKQKDEIPKYSTLATGLWDRCILHLDIDCFYCQCEEIDRNLRGSEIRPLAIGQKHIIVTCNYAARKYGVQKLQSREAAYAACPHLWIVEGSDLLHYRRHSRAVYEAFRTALQDIAKEITGKEEEEESSFRIPARKGCMDEMMADLTPAVERILLAKQHGHYTNNHDGSRAGTASAGGGNDNMQFRHDPEQVRFVFGQDAASSMAVLVEDQTGEKSIVSFQPPSNNTTSRNSTIEAQEASLAASRRNIHNLCEASEQDRLECQERFKIAAELTERVCHKIRQQTGFHTTGGISVSPLLAKLASGLNKPNSVNLLYPWRSAQLLYSMPLRKMHKVGHGTMKALETEMRGDVVAAPKSHPQDNSKTMRTVLDLLAMPRSSIRQALQGMNAFQAESSNDEPCDLLIQQCRGLDLSEIIDDEGGLPKTVSVENSFRRGTVQCLDAVHEALEDLYRRLPMLLQDRTSWATDPQKAYPNTIRLTIRMVDPDLARIKKRRPYVTKSKQSSIDGKRYLLQERSLQAQSNLIRQHIKPLLQQLLPTTINVTRMNIAITNFQDVANVDLKNGASSGQATLAESLERSKRLNSQSQLSPPIMTLSQASYHEPTARKRLKLTPAAGIRTNHRVSPSSLEASTSKSKGPRSSQGGRMKTTKIDHFFLKK